MKNLGYLLITVGFLAGALATMFDKQAVNWGLFAAALVGGIIGVVLVRVSIRQKTQAKEELTQNIGAIETSLEKICANATKLNSEKIDINVYDLRHKVDELFLDDLEIFVEARESIAHLYGLQSYADIMSTFAAGERYLNRVWSCSADGYVDEAVTYVEKSMEQFKVTLEKFRAIKQQATA